jgi:WD40 repeat protein
VAFSPNGKQVVSGLWDETVRLWDAAIEAPLKTLKGYTKWVTSVAFPPNSKQLPGLRVSDYWIVESDINILWLPLDYRGTRSATWNRSLIIVYLSGGISFFCFKEGGKLVIYN